MYVPSGAGKLHTWHDVSWVALHGCTRNSCPTTVSHPLSLYTMCVLGLHCLHSEHTVSFVELHTRDAYVPTGHTVHDINSLSTRPWHSFVL